MPENNGVRKPAAAGRFYPAEKEILARMVNDFLRNAKQCDIGPQTIKAIVVPHAGYVFSGATAGAAFACARDLNFETAVILGAGHTAGIKTAALYGKGSFSTPLGSLEIDGELSDYLIAKHPALFDVAPSAHLKEHSIEVQLPFLQTIKSKARILPVLLNFADAKTASAIGRALADALEGKKALIIASTDLSHYPPQAAARKGDLSTLKALEIAARINAPEYFAKAVEMLMARKLPGFETACCGEAAVMAAIAAACSLGADDFRLIEYSNSGQVPGADSENTVGYGAGAFVRRGGKAEVMDLTPEHKTELLKLARLSLETKLDSGRAYAPELSDRPIFNVPAAAFVTLTSDGDLRGCIGSLEPADTLQDAVCRLAVSAGFEDPRFEALTRVELAGIKIEISVLSPLRQITGPDEIVPGRHGVLIRKGRSGGTYLPQVWEHFNDDREKFMASLCAEKAGLPPDAWKKPGADIYVYTAQVFEE
ncbi:MAG: AmmeMemoRadiSam system protein B [Elusimicrobiaceae bacterium]